MTDTAATTDDLLRRAKAGDAAALGTLFAHYRDRLRQMVRERQTEALAAQLPDAVVDAVVVRGSYEEIGRALRRRYEGLVDRVASYWPFAPADRAGWERLARAFRSG